MPRTETVCRLEGAGIEQSETTRTSPGEERFRSLAEGLRDIVYRLRYEPERRTEYVNPAIGTVTGFPPAAYYSDEEMFRSRIHPDDLALIDLEPLARKGQHTAVIRFLRADDRWIRLEVRRTGLFEDGRLVGVQGIIQDVTERERIAQARERTAEALRTALEHERRSVEDLQALDALKSSFIRSVSHELRTPLTAVIGFSRLLARRADDLPPDRTAAIHERLLANAERIEQLLEDLLDTRAISGAADGLTLARTDVLGLVQSVVAAADLGGQRCEVVGEPLTAELDAAKVRRILEKLLHNSVKHTPSSTTITVRVIDAGDDVELVVEDDGPGIPDELHEEIFEPFRQGPQALDDPSPGTGVGLSIVARLVELHGGRVWVEDRPGGGTRVRLRLPQGGTRPETTDGGSRSALL